jgi:hypothetical protein
LPFTFLSPNVGRERTGCVVNTQHVDDLAGILCLARVLPEERFDELGRDHLRLNGGSRVPVATVKDVLIEQRRAYRLTVRGRNYLAYFPRLGEIYCKPVVPLDDAEDLLRRVVETADQTAPPKT